MRWPRLTRRSRRDARPAASASTFTPGSWGQPAAPAESHFVTAPTGNVEVILRSPSVVVGDQVSQPLVAPPPLVEQAARSGVRLGFTDGSDLELDPDHPHSLALKAVADVLLHRGPSRRHVG